MQGFRCRYWLLEGFVGSICDPRAVWVIAPTCRGNVAETPLAAALVGSTSRSCYIGLGVAGGAQSALLGSRLRKRLAACPHIHLVERECARMLEIAASSSAVSLQSARTINFGGHDYNKRVHGASRRKMVSCRDGKQGHGYSATYAVPREPRGDAEAQACERKLHKLS